jgi:crotonobetainyl-CoA:carnitine CoA-transferase CaiB-like acyl-CoA transferase
MGRGQHAGMQNLNTIDVMDAVPVTHTKAEWITAFDAAGVPVGAAHTVGEVKCICIRSRATWCSISNICRPARPRR